MYHQHAVIEPYLALAEMGLAEASTGNNSIEILIIFNKRCLNGI